MTGFRIERLKFDALEVQAWSEADPRHSNWPVVYTLDDTKDLYVGETLNGVGRMYQHLQNKDKQHLRRVHMVLDATFNKSACLDLESFLIRMFAGDGKFRILNRNDGIVDADYYSREFYRDKFNEIFEELRREGYFTRSIPEIENSDLFKLSPFKALTQDQAIAVEDILDGLFTDLGTRAQSTSVVQGEPGTGKTILAIYIVKLLSDIRTRRDVDAPEGDSIFSEFFVPENREMLRDFRLGLVIPQQSLRASIQAVFRRIPGLEPDMVLTPFQVGEATKPFDLLIVDEAHRLSQRAAQAMGTLTKQYSEINSNLFPNGTGLESQLDWIRELSRHQILLVDPDQAVRPADLPRETLMTLRRDALNHHRWYRLHSQMRVKAGSDYVGWIKEILRGETPQPPDFGDYDLRFFDDFDAMHDAIMQREREHGLSRLLAGYAWNWRSRKDRSQFDIELGSHRMRWNSRLKDWVNSKDSLDEVGSIHTIQGYDLNYAGVIIGRDLVFDPTLGRTAFNRERYFDARGRANNNFLNRKYSDDDLLVYVRNIYSVLMTRGILGTYVYIEDEQLRAQVSRVIGGSLRLIDGSNSI